MRDEQNLISHTIVQTKSIVEENKKYSILECVFAYVMLVVGFCFMRFVVFNITGLFTTIFFIGLAFTLQFYLKKNNYTLYKNHRIMFGFILLFSIVFSITANNFIKMLNVIFLLILGIYWFYAVSNNNRQLGRFFFFDLLKALFILPFINFGEAFKVIADSSGKSRLGTNIKLILFGLIATIPLTMVVAILLTSADQGVEDILHVLFNNFFEEILLTILQFTFGILVASYIFGMMYANVKNDKKEVTTMEQYESKMKRLKLFPHIVMYSAVTPILILYVIFFVSQLQYFISAFHQTLPKAFSYAQYARRGFFELFVISIINMMILLIINIFSKHSSEKKPVLLKIYSILLSVFTILIIATAISKMILYINKYGLTQLRVYASWFMILLVGVFVLFIIWQFKTKLNFIKYSVVYFIMMFGVLCFSNLDGNIARFNIKMYQAGYLNELDTKALCNLSDDAIVILLKEGINTKDYLETKLNYYEDESYAKYNLSSLRVKILLESR